jgi:hypothetical protein
MTYFTQKDNTNRIGRERQKKRSFFLFGRFYLKHNFLGDLQIQCNPHQNSNGVLHKNKKNNPSIHTEVKRRAGM